MKRMKLVIIGIILVNFVGCICPRKKIVEQKPEEKKPELVSILKPEETKPPEQAILPEEKKLPTEEGKATPEEIKTVIKGEDVPITPIPTDVKFVKPEEISPELKEIFQNIYFDFDKYDIREDAAKTLKKIGEYLLKNQDIKILIEGHCDERGTREYNLVLGEQRALSARRFLIVMGVSPKRLYTVSYGEDMPAVLGSNEEAWAKNRRCEFKIEVKK